MADRADDEPAFGEGDIVRYHPPTAEKAREGTVIGRRPVRGVIGVQLVGDPFGACLPVQHLTLLKGGGSSVSSVSELRKEAVELGIEGYEELSIEELEAAVREAKGGEQPVATKTRSRPKKSAAKRSRSRPKASARPKASTNGSNPFRTGSSMAFIFDELMKGGTVDEIGKKAARKFPINVRSKNVDDEASYVLNHSKARTLLVLKKAKEAGFTTVKKGRGGEAQVQIKNKSR